MHRNTVTALGFAVLTVLIGGLPAAAQNPTTKPVITLAKPEAEKDQAVALLTRVRQKIKAATAWSGEVVTINRSKDGERGKMQIFRQRGMKFFYVEEWKMEKTGDKWKPVKRTMTMVSDGVNFYRLNAENEYIQRKASGQGMEIPLNSLILSLNGYSDEKFTELLEKGNEMLRPAVYSGKEEWQGQLMEVVQLRIRDGKPESDKDKVEMLLYIGADGLIQRIILKKGEDDEEEIYFVKFKLNSAPPASEFVFTPPPGAKLIGAKP
jgi:outer membrane lipoprotein-sorting protein